MKMALKGRSLLFTGTAAVLPLLQSCAVVSHAIDPDVSACIDGQGKAHIAVQNIETIRGSRHTPFDYGNKSANRVTYVVVIPVEIGQWTGANVEVFAAKFRQEKTTGTVTVAKNSLTFDLYVAARDLPDYS